MTLTKQTQNTIARLKAKATINTGVEKRMPSLKLISEALTELGIEHKFNNTEGLKKTRPDGCPYYTGGGTKLYTGYILKLPEHRLTMDSTDSYYSWNTGGYARKLLEIIELEND